MSERTKESFDSYKDEATVSALRSERSLICSRGGLLMRMDRLMKTPSMMMPVKQQKEPAVFYEQFSIIRKKIQRNWIKFLDNLLDSRKI